MIYYQVTYKVTEFLKYTLFKILEKKIYTRTRIRVEGFYNWLKFQPFFLIGELRKGVIIDCIERKGTWKKHST